MKRVSIADLIERDLGISERQLKNLVDGSDSLYRRKRLKGRTLDVPAPDLKLVQCWISDFLRTVDPKLPPCVTAYETNCSIVTNAKMHCGHAHVLTLDISNFFHSCKGNLVWRMFSTLNVDFGDGLKPRRLFVDELDLLTRLTCFRGSLTVGSPSSPAIANRIMLPADIDIVQRLSSTMSYTRYSDDMTFSSDSWIDIEMVTDLVSEVLDAYGFRLNRGKTKCAGKGNRRVVTGIVVRPDGGLSIGSERKRDIKRELYALLVHGEGDPLATLGRMYFAIQVEPSWAARILAKYSNYGDAREGGVICALRKLASRVDG